MKFLSMITGLAAVAIATPTPTSEEGAGPVLGKRASVTEIANLGYATQNGGYVGRRLLLAASSSVSNMSNAVM